MKKSIFITLVILGMINVVVSSYVSLRNYKEYYKATETMLDSIANQEPSYFLDDLMEQDVYEYYWKIKNKID